MERLSCPHKDVVTAVFGIKSEIVKHPFEFAGNIVDLFFGRPAVFIRFALDVYPMFVGAGQKICIKSSLPFVAPDRVRHDGRVQMTEVRQAVRIVNRRCYIEGLHPEKTKV